jgi:hypothetical protein
LIRRFAGHSPNHRRNIGLRPKCRDQLLDFPLALVTHRGEHVAVILGREMRRQQAHRCERNGAFGKQIEHDWQSPRDTSRLDTRVRGVLGEVKNLDAIGEEGGAVPAQ